MHTFDHLNRLTMQIQEVYISHSSKFFFHTYRCRIARRCRCVTLIIHPQRFQNFIQNCSLAYSFYAGPTEHTAPPVTEALLAEYARLGQWYKFDDEQVC
jgi:hypothetical protein